MSISSAQSCHEYCWINAYAVIDFSSEQGPNTYEGIFQPNGPFHNTLVNGYATELENLPLIIVLPETENITLLEMAGEVSATGTSMRPSYGNLCRD